MNKYHLLITYTYATLRNSVEAYLIVSPSYIGFIKSLQIYHVKFHYKDFSYVHWLYFKKSEHAYQNYNVLVSISKKKWTSLLNDLPLKLVTSLPTIVTTSAPPSVGHPKLFGQLGRCAPGKTVYCYHGCWIHPYRI